MTQLSRRGLLAGTAAVTAATAIGPLAAPTPARAAAPLAGKQAPGFYRYKLGDFEITALYDGEWLRDLNEQYVPGVPIAEMQKALADDFVPVGKTRTPITTLVVNTGSKLVLIDTGTGGRLGGATGSWSDNFAAAGFNPAQVDTIVISHFHPDHIGGIRTKDEQLAFPSAEIMVPAPEWAWWMDDARMNAAPEAARGMFTNSRRVFGSIANNVTRFDPGKEVSPGIVTVAAPGHTPGHTAFIVTSGSASLLTVVDSVSYPAVWARNPDWQFFFDTDRAMGVETRKRLLDRATADKLPVTAYHWPFPALGRITKEGNGYRMHPVGYSHLL
jgi:glyoxylase-like metal-dependent hydrolase (beta-lactamase superfamily II)